MVKDPELSIRRAIEFLPRSAAKAYVESRVNYYYARSRELTIRDLNREIWYRAYCNVLDGLE